jgi:hypothetical protein
MATSQPRGGGAYTKHGLPSTCPAKVSGGIVEARSSSSWRSWPLHPGARAQESSRVARPADSLQPICGDCTGASERYAAPGLEIWIGFRVLEVEECHSIQMGSERKIRLYVPYKRADGLENFKRSQSPWQGFRLADSPSSDGLALRADWGTGFWGSCFARN